MNYPRITILLGLAGGLWACGGPPELESAEDEIVAPTCSAAVLSDVLAPASTGHTSVQLRCSLTIPRNADGTAKTINKRILITGAAASGVRVDCNGARLVRSAVDGNADRLYISSSKLSATSWSRPEDVTVQRCVIEGAVRIAGMGPNGQAPDLRDSSHVDANHTARAQAAAPTRITLSRLTIIGVGRIPLYLAPGVTNVRVEASSIGGVSGGTAVYLDAESANNVFKNNTISTDTQSDSIVGPRELVAIDGSAGNLFVGNQFSHLEDGGIFLYRNCGEGGTIRVQSPVWNQFINNRFYYQNSTSTALNVASRTGNFLWHNPFDFCSDDETDHKSWGSAVNDDDLVHHTVAVQNQIRVRSASEVFDFNDGPNHVFNNPTVAELSVIRSGCFLPGLGAFLNDGESIPAISGSGAVSCPATRVSCSDGEITRTPITGACPIATTVAFGCQRSGNDAGCSSTVTCPAGMRLAEVRAACDLETGTLTAAQLSATPWHTLNVARPSDRVSDGRCIAGSASRQEGSGAADVFRTNSLSYGCSEHDSNGGDCQILGQALCVPLL